MPMKFTMNSATSHIEVMSRHFWRMEKHYSSQVLARQGQTRVCLILPSAHRELGQGQNMVVHVVWGRILGEEPGCTPPLGKCERIVLSIENAQAS